MKLSFLKQLIIDDLTLIKAKQADNIKDFINIINPYYPGLNLVDYSIEEIERALKDVYIRLIAKIIQYSPDNLRSFLRDLLLKNEIQNIKQIILGTILGLTKDEKKKLINFQIEDYLGKRDFISELLEFPSLEEIQFKLKDTIYNKAVREGILYFNQTNEIFVLEAFLDRLYYIHLLERRKSYKTKHRDFLYLYIDYNIEIFNLNMIYRGILNDLDKKLLNQFLVEHYIILDKEKLATLANLTNTIEFFDQLEMIYKQSDKIQKIYKKIGINRKHLIWSLRGLYQELYFDRYKTHLEHIDYSTIYKIIEIIIRKEKEITFDILPTVVKIIHKKFYYLKESGDV